MSCPICGSKNVREMDNLHCLWDCGDCGYTDDGEEFDDALNSGAVMIRFDNNDLKEIGEARLGGFEIDCEYE